MKIAQIVAANAGEYERKSQRIDFAALTEAGHEVGVYPTPGAQIVHVYGRTKVRGKHVIDADVELPEAVEEHFWSAAPERRFESGGSAAALRCGSFSRKSIQNIVQQTYARISRMRDDVEWRLFERAPSPEEMTGIAVWVDPGDDRDGFTAEALVAGNVVVAARTTVNVRRLEQGRTGFLVPPNDPNELTHAILSALFKPELGQARASAARQTISKFRPRQRLRALTTLYESLLR
jgi:hypothetical protein